MINNTSIQLNNISFNKRKIPRYVYHITNDKHYQSIIQNGQITTSNLLIGGVFTIGLTNFFKRWRKDISWKNKLLQEKLLLHVKKDSNKIIILRIPIAKLDNKKLVIRGQNTTFSWGNRHEAKLRIIFEKLKTIANLSDKRKVFLDFIQKSEQNRQMVEMLMGNTPADRYKHFTQKKEALEFIYKDNIPVEITEKIGEVDIAELKQTPEYDPTRPMRSIFTALLKGTPEVKGAELLNC